MRRFKVDPLAQVELDDAAGWFEQEREGLGLEFIEEVDRVLARIETQEKFVTSPLVVLDWCCSERVRSALPVRRRLR